VYAIRASAEALTLALFASGRRGLAVRGTFVRRVFERDSHAQPDRADGEDEPGTQPFHV
jgi:hypothetical protein